MVLSGRAALCDPLRGGCEGAARGLPAVSSLGSGAVRRGCLPPACLWVMESQRSAR